MTKLLTNSGLTQIVIKPNLQMGNSILSHLTYVT